MSNKPFVTGDHSFNHGCFPISIQYLTTALGRILFSSVIMVLASLVQIGSGFYISAMHLFICFFVTDFVREMGAPPGLANEPLIPFHVKKWTFCLMGFPSSIHDDCKRGGVTGGHSFKHGCFPI